MISMLHDDFLDQSKHMLDEIKKFEKNGDAKGAAKAELDFANFKVHYYEQFVGEGEPESIYDKMYQDDYYWALINRANVRDKCMDLGLFEN